MASRHSRLIAVAAAGLALPHAALAQVAPPPFAGARVRVVDQASGLPELTGSLVRLAGDTVVISRGGAAAIPIALGSTRRLEMSTGPHSHTLRGMGLGFLAGVGIGTVVGLATYQKPVCNAQQFLCLDFGPGASAMAGAVVFSLPGMIIGAIAGANDKSESWSPVEPSRIHVSLAPARGGGVTLGGSFAF